MIKVMLVDDHKLVREGIRQLIEQNDDMEVTAEASNGIECLAKLRSAKADLIILDINMPEMNGFETLTALNKRKKPPKILILTSSTEIECLMQAIELGINGYLLKSVTASELFQAIRYVSAGEKYIQPSMIPLFNSKIIAMELDKERLKLLSGRELEVLKLVAEGYLNKNIGEMLSISERTVKNHIFNIFRKIGCSDRTQAAVFCFRNGIVNVQH